MGAHDVLCFFCFATITPDSEHHCFLMWYHVAWPWKPFEWCDISATVSVPWLPVAPVFDPAMPVRTVSRTQRTHSELTAWLTIPSPSFVYHLKHADWWRSTELSVQEDEVNALLPLHRGEGAPLPQLSQCCCYSPIFREFLFTVDECWLDAEQAWIYVRCFVLESGNVDELLN